MVRVSVRQPRISYEAIAEIMSEAEYNQSSILDTIKVESQELAEKIVIRYNLERLEKGNLISLALALALVQKEIGEEQNIKLKQDEPMAIKFAKLRSEREQSFAQLQDEAREELLRDALEQRALLRVKLLSTIMPTLMQQNFDNFKASGGSYSLTPTDVIKAGYQIVDQMIKQSGLDDI